MRTKRTSMALVLLLSLGLSFFASTVHAEQGGPVYKLEWLDAWYEGTAATLPKTVSPDSLSVSPGMNYTTVQRLQLTFSFSGEEQAVVPANTVEIRIPASVFEDALGNPAESSVVVPLPMNTSFNYWKDPATNEFVIYNFSEISEALVFTLQIDYKVRPSNVGLPSSPGTAIEPYTNQVQAVVTVSRPNTQPVSTVTNTLNLSYTTNSKLSSVSKTVPSSAYYYASWPSAWGPVPADALDYFYLTWRIRVNLPSTNTQSFFVNLTDTLTEADGGQVVGWSLPATGTAYANLADGWANNLQELNAAAANAIRVVTPSTYTTYYDAFVHMRYPRRMLQLSAAGDALEYRVTNKAAAELVGDYGATDYKEGLGSFLYREIPWKPVPGSSGSKSILGHSPGMIDRLENAWLAGKTGALALHPNSSYTWSVSSSAQEDWRRTQDATGAYGVVPWTAYHLDNQFSFDTYTTGSSSYYPLGPGDYALTRLTLYQPSEQIYGAPDIFGANTLIPQTPDKYGQVTIQVTTVQNPGESDWLTIGTSRLKPALNTGWTYTPAGGTAVSMGNYGTYTVDLKQAVTSGDVLGVRMLQTTTAARVTQSYNLLMSLYPSRRVIDGLRAAPTRTGDIRSSVNLYNTAYNWASGGSIAADSARRTMYSYLTMNRQTYSSYHYKSISSPYIDYAARNVRLPVTLYAYNSTPFPSGTTQTEAMAMELLQEQKEGIFYDLLPIGTIVDTSSIRISTYRGGYVATYGVDYSVEVIDNFRNTGRSLLIIRMTTPETLSNFYYSNYSLYTGYYATFNVINTFDNLLDNPKAGRNYSAYESTVGPLGSGRPDLPPASGFTDAAAQTAFNNINSKAETDSYRFMHAYADWSVNPPLATELGFNKLVKTPEDAAFSKETVAQGGGTYTYRLRLANRPETSSRNLIFYDSMEDRAPDGEEFWQGTLEAIDLTHPRLTWGVEPVVYYATREVDPKYVVEDRLVVDDVLNTALWKVLDVTQTPYPADLKAIAVDMRYLPNGTPFVLPPERSLIIQMTMRAPGDVTPYVNPTDYAWNSAYLSAQTQRDGILSANAVVDVTPTKVSLRPVDLEVTKSSAPATGTPEAPAIVYDGNTLTYTVAVRNTNGAEAITEIVLEDVIPAGLTINTPQIRFRFGATGTQLLSATTRIALTQTGQKLSFQIDRLAAGERVEFTIPTTVNKPLTENNVLHVNTAEVTRAFGFEQDIQSPATYHETPVVKLQLPFRKLLDAGGRVPKAGEFQVVLTDSTAARNIVAGPFTNSGDAPYNFDIPVLFGRPGYYYYYLKEVVPSAPETGMTYSNVEFYIMVDVRYNTTTRSLYVNSTTIRLNGLLQTDPKIINTYRASGSYFPSIRKRLFVRGADGVTLTDYPFSNDQYRVTLLDDFGRVQEASNIDGVFTFLERFATQAEIGHTFKFWFTEQVGTQDSVLYDGRTIRMEVTVVDAGNGQLNYIERFFNQDDEILTDDEEITGQIENEFLTARKTVTKKWTLPIAPGYDALPDPLPSIWVQLYRDGTAFGDAIEMTPANATLVTGTPPTYAEWVYTWQNLPRLQPGTANPSVYTVQELAPPAQFQLTQDGDVLTNKFQKGTFTARKLWSGLPEGYTGLPAVTLKLYRTILNDPQPALGRYEYMAGMDATLNGTVDVAADGSGEVSEWAYRWVGLPATGTMQWTDVNGQTGTAANVSFEYEVREAAFAADAANADDFYIDTKASASTYVTNRYIKTSFKAFKEWENGPVSSRPQVLLQLLQNGVPYSAAGVTNPAAINTPADHDGTPLPHTWEDLPLYSYMDAGTQYTYSFAEVQADPGNPGSYVPITAPQTGFPYQPRYTEDGTRVINAYVRPIIEVAAIKTWNNGPLADHQAVELELRRRPLTPEVLADPTLPWEPVHEEPLASGASPGPYTYTWTGMPQTTLAGYPYEYMVVEVTGQDGIVMMNQNLYAITTTTATDTVTGNITVNLTNTYQVPTGSVYATKAWVGGVKADHQPAALLLYQQNAAMTEPQLVPQIAGNPVIVSSPDAEGLFDYEWKNLELADNLARPYLFTVVEQDAVNGHVTVGERSYAVSVVGRGVINRYVPPVTEVVATKVWQDGPLADHRAVQLLLNRQTLVDGVAGEHQAVPVSPDIQHTGSTFVYHWVNLPATDNNANRYLYSVQEAGVENGELVIGTPPAEGAVVSPEALPRVYAVSYQVTSNAPERKEITVTNRFTIPRGSITASKRWIGGDPKDHKAVAIDLYYHTSAAPTPVLVENSATTLADGAPSQFLYTWENLPLTNPAGEALIYTAAERGAVNGMVQIGEHMYAVNAIGRDVFNTYLQPLTDLTASKTWVGGPEADHRPVAIDLYRWARGLRDPHPIVAIPEVTGEGPYLYTWKNLPMTSMAAEPFIYTLLEADEVNGQIDVNGNLYSVAKEGSNPTHFTNRYMPPPPPPPTPVADPDYPTLEVPLTARKVLANGTLQAGEFAFVLKDAKGNVLAEVGNLADGTVIFPNRTFSRVVRDYTYTITEQQGSDSKTTYDAAVYTVHVTTAAVNGLLQAQVDVLKDGTPYAGQIVFTNQRKLPPTGDRTVAVIAMLLAASAVLSAGALAANRRARRNER